MEVHQKSMPFYLFFNQLMTSHIFYELRAYGVHNDTMNARPMYQSATPSLTARNPYGYGGGAALGYNLNIMPSISLLPFIRGQVLSNTFLAYSDSLNNALGSIDYGGLIGVKLSARMTDRFALYSIGFLGYQWSLISGSGIFSPPTATTVNVYLPGFEFGAPYKIKKTPISITSYASILWVTINPNQAAIQFVFPMTQSTHFNYAYGIKVGYEF